MAGDYLARWVPWDWAHNSIMFSLITGMAVLVGVWILFKYILLMVLGPILSLISEKAERKFRGYNAGKGFSVAGSAARGIRINARNIVKEVVLSVVLLLLGLIPGIHILAWILLFLIQFYFVGFGIMDFYLERHLTFKETLSEVYKHKWAAITLGAIFTTLMLVPFLGVLIAPYLCTMAATQYFLNAERSGV
jgi:CysZ protein